MNNKVFAGAVAPVRIAANIVPSDELEDLTTVQTVSFSVRRGNGETTTWSASIAEQSTSALEMYHALAEGDVPAADNLTITPQLVTAGGTKRCRSFILRVLPSGG